MNIRRALQRAVEHRIKAIWGAEPGATVAQIGTDPAQEFERIGTMISNLEAQPENQQWLKSRALEWTESLLAARWGIFAGRDSAIPDAFLVIITFWLAAAFGGYALFAPPNDTMTGILVVSAFSVACAIFLILELGNPFEGGIVVSGDPMRFALAHLGQ